MKKICRFSTLLILLLFALTGQAATESAKKALLLSVDGAIGPAIADYLARGIEQASERGAQLVLIKLDTPGGLDKSMRVIIKAILESTVPVVTYVAPSGARAASAGTFILYASHVAAMAPGTNLGAASPVSLGGGGALPGTSDEKKDKNTKQRGLTDKEKMAAKVSNDATAYIRSLAQLRGRNVAFAEKAVREAKSLTAREALKANVIDVIAGDLTELLQKVNGLKVQVQGQSWVIDSVDLQLEAITPDWRSRFLAIITDPSVAYVLLLLGVYGLFFEFANPGFVAPGVIGAIALLLAMYALQLLPISYAGLALIGLGIIFMIAELYMPSFGALGLGGVVAFIMGSILLFDTDLPGYYVAWPLIFAMAALNVAFFVFVLGMAMQARRQQVVSGRERLLDRHGVVLTFAGGQGQMKIDGEIWLIRADQSLKAGDSVIVDNVDGLILSVKLST